MTIARKLSSGTLWVTMATLLGRVGTFLGNIVVIRLLSKISVGELGLIESWMGMAVMFATIGLNTSVTKYIAEHLELQPERVGRIVGAALLLTTSTTLLASLIVLSGSHWGWWRVAGVSSTFIVNYKFLFAGLVAAQVIRAMVNGVIYGVQAFSSLVTTNILIGLASFPTMYALVSCRYLAGALEAKLILTLLETILLSRAAQLALRKHQVSISVSGCRREMRQLAALGVPALLGGVAAGPVQPLMMSWLASQPGGIGQVALITTATRLCSMVNFLPNSVASILTPILAGEWGNGKPKEFGRSLTFAMRMFWLSTLPPIIFFLAASPTLIKWLYGADFIEAWPIAFAMLVMALLTNLNQTADRAFIAANRIWLSISNNFVWLLLFIPLAAWWIPKYLGLGYATAFLVSFSLYVALQMWWMQRLLHVKIKPILLMIGASLSFIVLAGALAFVKSPRVQITAAVLLAVAAVGFEWRFLLVGSERQKLMQRLKRGDRAKGSMSK